MNTTHNWSRRRTEIPAPIPSENPLAEAMAQWPVLQANYASVVDQLREADDLTNRLLLENESLRRENDHLRETHLEQITILQRERNLLAAYGTEVRTQLTIIREVIEGAERKALQQAAQAGSAPRVDPAEPVAQAEPEPFDQDTIDREAVRIAESIARINPRELGGGGSDGPVGILPPNSYR